MLPKLNETIQLDTNSDIVVELHYSAAIGVRAVAESYLYVNDDEIGSGTASAMCIANQETVFEIRFKPTVEKIFENSSVQLKTVFYVDSAKINIGQISFFVYKSKIILPRLFINNEEIANKTANNTEIEGKNLHKTPGYDSSEMIFGVGLASLLSVIFATRRRAVR